MACSSWEENALRWQNIPEICMNAKHPTPEPEPPAASAPKPKSKPQRKAWRKPVLKRLGALKSVGNPSFPI